MRVGKIMRRGTVALSNVLLLFMIALTLISCGQKKTLAYYADTDNYITVTGTVSYAKLSEDASSLYLAFDDMSLQLSDNCFKVVGKIISISPQFGRIGILRIMTMNGKMVKNVELEVTLCQR